MYKYALIIIFGLLIAGCSTPPPQQKTNPAVPVITAEAEEKDIPIYFESLGTLKSALYVDVKPQASGTLLSVHFIEGQVVKKGQLLFTIDSQSYQIKLQEAEAQLTHDKAVLDGARKKLERYEGLSKKDLIPQQEWDELVTQVNKSEAQVHMDDTKIVSARLDIQHCSIKSPIEGKTGKLAVHSGNLIAAQITPLVTIANIDHLFVEFTLTEREFQQLTAKHLNGSYPIEINSFNQATSTKGTLTFLNHGFDLNSGLLHVRGDVINDKMLFLPGQNVKVRLPISVIKSAKVIPQMAVKINQNGPYVYVVKENNLVELCQLKLGEEIADCVVVLEGLNAGDKVVTEGHLRLFPGTTVELK